MFNSTPDDLDMHVVYDVSHNIAKVRVPSPWERYTRAYVRSSGLDSARSRSTLLTASCVRYSSTARRVLQTCRGVVVAVRVPLSDA